MDTSRARIEELARLMEECGLAELEVSEGDERLSLRRATTAGPSPDVAPPASPPRGAFPWSAAAQPRGHVALSRTAGPGAQVEAPVRPEPAPSRVSGATPAGGAPGGGGARESRVASPIAGIFYRQPQPGEPPYAGPGQHVRKGEVVCIVEAMKMINEVCADQDGTVRAFLAENEQFVEYGSPLVVIEGD